METYGGNPTTLIKPKSLAKPVSGLRAEKKNY
jgi:hypothetical protein